MTFQNAQLTVISEETKKTPNLLQATTGVHTGIEPSIDQLLQVTLKSLAEVLEHRRTSRKDDVLRQTQSVSAKGHHEMD